MELGNWPIKDQLGSTNSKGLPVLFQGSHQVFFPNNIIIYSTSSIASSCSASKLLCALSIDSKSPSMSASESSPSANRVRRPPWSYRHEPWPAKLVPKIAAKKIPFLAPLANQAGA